MSKLMGDEKQEDEPEGDGALGGYPERTGAGDFHLPFSQPLKEIGESAVTPLDNLTFHP